MIRYEGNIPVDLKWENGEKFLFVSRDQSKFTHGAHKYPAKFFPELPRWAIQRYTTKGDVVLDPFMGSGTTNVEAMLLDRDSIGVDIDPFSKLISKVKTTPVDSQILREELAKLEQKIAEYDPSKFYPSPNFPYKDNWFRDYVTNELAYLRLLIGDIDDKDVRECMLVCFSSIIRRVSQADDFCTRTVIRKNKVKEIPTGYSFELFVKRTRNFIAGMASYSSSVNGAKVRIMPNSSATDMSAIERDSVAAAVTSPPYVNAVDYPRTHQLELYWLELASGSLQPLKKSHVGTETVSAGDYHYLHLTGLSSADPIIEKIFKMDRRRAYISYKYIADMQDNLSETYRVLKKGGKYIIVVGSNKIRGELFENWKYLLEAGEKAGFQVESYFISTIINHFIRIPRGERINDDYVLVLRK